MPNDNLSDLIPANNSTKKNSLQEIIDHIRNNKDGIKEGIAKQSGTSVKEVEQTLPQLQSALQEQLKGIMGPNSSSSPIPASSGGGRYVLHHTTGLSVTGNKQASPSVQASQPAAQAPQITPQPEDPAPQPAAPAADVPSAAAPLTNQEKIYMALMGSVPILLGSVFQGYQGGAIGGAVASKGVTDMAGSIKETNAGKYAAAQQDLKNKREQTALDNQTQALKNTTEYQRRSMQNQEARTAVAQTNANTNQARTNAIISKLDKGKQVPAQVAVDLGKFKTGEASLDDLAKTVEMNKNVFGPMMGLWTQNNPYHHQGQAMILNIQKNIPLIAQSIEGKTLTDQQTKHWVQMFGGLNQTPEVMQSKIDIMKRALGLAAKGTHQSLADLGFNVEGASIPPVTDGPAVLHKGSENAGPPKTPVSPKIKEYMDKYHVSEEGAQELIDLSEKKKNKKGKDAK